MKKIFLLLLVVVIVACKDDEQSFVNLNWSNLNGVINPDTLQEHLKFDAVNYDAFIRSALFYSDFPAEDSLRQRFILGTYFKKANGFTNVDNFTINDNKVNYLDQLVYPNYYYNTEEAFLFSESEHKISFKDNNQEYIYNYNVEDVFKNITISNNKLNTDIEISYDGNWDILSFHSFVVYINDNTDNTNFSLNQLYQEISSGQNIIISKSKIEQAIVEKFNLNLENVSKISFQIMASDTSEITLGNRKTLLYKNASKIYNFDYNN